MLQPYAVSVVCERADGFTEHHLYIINSNSTDAAEGLVMAVCAKARMPIESMIARPMISEAADGSALIV